jgi:hypothetical protein
MPWDPVSGVQDAKSMRTTYTEIKCHFHSEYSRKAPIISDPMPAPTGGDAANMASVKLRTLPGGTIIVRVATALGIKIPPPTPVRARIAIKEL